MISVQSVVFALIIKTDNTEADLIATSVPDSAGSNWDPVLGYCKQGKEELDSTQDKSKGIHILMDSFVNPYPTAFPYGNGMVLHFYQQQESSTTKTVHKVINKGLKAYV